MKTLVMKFGGSSVGTTSALIQVLSIVLNEREQWDRLVLVVSALDGVTDMLIEAAGLANMGNQRGYRRIVANLRTRHLAMIEELPLGNSERGALQADIDRLLFDMLDIYQGMTHSSDRWAATQKLDASIGVGEKLAARIIAALLRQNDVRSVAIDTTNLIVTDDSHGNAIPNIAMSRTQIATNVLPLLERGIVPVITGFIGATRSGQPTTLGRGGSDLTASILGAGVGAQEIWLWTDVDGLMTADPREVDTAQVIPHLSYEEAAELAYFGARILHTRMLAPIQSEHIPVWIKNVFKPQKPGSNISPGSGRSELTIKAVTSIAGVALTADHSGSLSTISALVDQTLYENTRSHADVMISSQSSTRSFLCVLIPTAAGPDAIHNTHIALEKKLSEQAADGGWRVNTVSIITAISDSFDHRPQLVAQVLNALRNLPILGLAQGPSNCSFSVVVNSHYADEALIRIHELILNPH
jgi:aspartate kinase